MGDESANVELVRLGLAAYEREGVEGLLAFADPEIEIYIEPTLAGTGTYRGHEGLRHSGREWLEAWQDFHVAPTDFIEVGEYIVVVPNHQVATGRESGVRVEGDITYLIEFREGKCTRFHTYADTDRALKAAKRLAGEQ
jgi:ketosteroid isomerase-like protein